MTDIDYKEIKLSIIIPVYNAEKYIRECLESIFRQGLIDSDFEVILVDDGSVDNSLCVIKDIIDRHDNIFIIKQENQGPSVARNKGIMFANGIYLLFVDSDDMLLDNVLPTLLKKAMNNNVDILVGDYLRLDSKKISEKQYISNNDVFFICKNGFDLYIEDLDPSHSYLWRTLYRKKYIIENDLVSAMEGFCFEDIPFVHECYLRANNCIKTNMKVCIYRVGHDSLTASIDKRKILELNKSIGKIWELPQKLNLPHNMLVYVKDNIFSIISFELWCISHNRFLMDIYDELLSDLKFKVQKISFNNGLKQRFISFMFWKFPYVYLKMRSFF